MMEPRLAYLAQGKLHVRTGGAAEIVESQFGRSLRERAVQIHNRHAWKMEGRGAQFMQGALWAGQPGDPGEFRIAITSIAPGRGEGELLYSLETPDVSGIFTVDGDGVETRVFHTADFRVRHLSLGPDGSTIAASIFHQNVTSNIAVIQLSGTDFFEATDGDSFDLAPRWVPGRRRKLVFQTAGVGRDSSGRIAGIGPFTVQELDLESGDMACVAEEEGFDLLGPQMTEDGTLYYIRRPYESGKRKVSVVHALKDTVLFPFRLVQAIFQYFNFFSMRYTGKPLASSQGAASRQPDVRQMMVWGNLIDADRAARENQFGDADAPALVPSSWQLVRRSADGETSVIAKGILSFDLAEDGSLVYSNGSAIHRRPAGSGREERILVGKMIEQVALL